MRENTLTKLRQKLHPGYVYRRNDFTETSSNVDRHLKQLVTEGSLQKLAYGLYTVPKKNFFGVSPPHEHSLIKTFLNDDHFVVYNPSQFNSLGLGTTQLYNKRVVFNRKRSGDFYLANKKYHFYRWREAPKKISREFLLVEMLNKLDLLLEDKEMVLKNLATSLHKFNRRKLLFALDHYGTITTKNTLKQLLDNYGK